MPSMRLTIAGALGSANAASEIIREATAENSHVVTLPAAAAGTMNRTDDASGTLTLAEGHGIQTGDHIDIYWAAGVAYGATVGTVAGNSVPFSAARGDAIPVGTATAITAAKTTAIDDDFVGDNAKAIIIKCTKRAKFRFWYSGGPLVIDLNANEPYLWYDGLGTNPLEGLTITGFIATQSDVAEQDIVIGILRDSA